MAFPVVQGVATSTRSSNATTTVVTFDAAASAGDLILVFHGSDSGAGANTYPAGWVELVDAAGSGFQASIAYLIATGGETSVTVTHTSERANAIAVRISGWHGTTAPEVSTAATGSSTQPNPGSLTPSWGADDTLWIAAAFADDSATPFPITAWPTNYASNQTQGSTAASAADVAIATRNLNAASEDPGAFTMTATETWSAYTVAVRPAAAGGGGSPVTVTPGVASLALSALAPTVSVSDNKVVTPGLASLTLSAQTPTVTATANKTATPGVASLTLTALTPSVNVGLNIVPGVASLSLTALTPTVTATANKTITPGVASLALTALTPTVTASDHKTVTIGLATLVLTAFTPVVTAGSTPVVPGTATCAITLLHTATATVGLSATATASLSQPASATATVG